jgi:diguanylate cyclase (GGDEF)-like protein
MLGWAAGEVIRVGDYLLHGPRSGAPLAAHVLFLGATVLVPVAVLLLFGTRRFTSLRTLLDALLVAAGTLYLTWAGALGPAYHARGGGLDALVSLVYPLADVAFIAMVLILVRDAAPVVRTPAVLAAAGLILKCGSDFASSYFSVRATHGQGVVTDLGWLLAFTVIAGATPRRHEVAGLAEDPDDESGFPYLPYVPFVAAIGTAVVLFVTRHGQVEPILRVISAVLVILMVIRQLIVLRDNRVLTRRLQGAVDDLRFRAYHDPLTRVGNRDMFLEAVEGALAPTTGGQVGVLYIDLDGFKPINDNLGHEAGDRVLTVVAERLARAARGGDVVARLGGDEFAVMLPDLLHTGDAQTVAQRIQSALDVGIDLDGDVVQVGASIGVAHGLAGRIGVGELLRNADVAMYTAKRQGRRRTVTFEPDLLSHHPLGRVS